MGRKRTILKPKYSRFPVPRNILLAANDFDYFEWSVIIELLDQLQSRMTLDNQAVLSMEIEDITLSYTEITPQKEARDILFERLALLRKKEIRYRVLIPGNQVEVCTGLFASVIRETRGGCVYVRIQKEAIPWLLALGSGFTYVERQVFDACHTMYQRRAYLYVCSRMRRSNSASFTASIDDWRKAIGCPQSDTPTMIIKRYILPLQDIINDSRYNSHYQCAFKDERKKKVQGAGRKGITAISATMHLKQEYADKQSDYGKILVIFNRYYSNLSSSEKESLRPMASIVDDIYEKPGARQVLFENDKRYSEKFHNDYAHVAHTIFAILLDRQGINVKKNASREIKRDKNG